MDLVAGKRQRLVWVKAELRKAKDRVRELEVLQRELKCELKQHEAKKDLLRALDRLREGDLRFYLLTKHTPDPRKVCGDMEVDTVEVCARGVVLDYEDSETEGYFNDEDKFHTVGTSYEVFTPLRHELNLFAQAKERGLTPSDLCDFGEWAMERIEGTCEVLFKLQYVWCITNPPK